MAHFAHVPRDHEQDGREAAQRYCGGQWREQQDHEDEKHGMDYPGERTGGAIADIGGGARDRAGGGEPAEQRRHDVGNALTDEFLIRIVPGARHAVGHHGGQQRFDRTQQCDGEGRVFRKEQRRDGQN